MGNVVNMPSRKFSPEAKDALTKDLSYVASAHYRKGATLEEVIDSAAKLIGRCLVRLDPNVSDEALRTKVYNRIMGHYTEEIVLDACEHWVKENRLEGD